jgi:hypothetical protein
MVAQKSCMVYAAKMKKKNICKSCFCSWLANASMAVRLREKYQISQHLILHPNPSASYFPLV